MAEAYELRRIKQINISRRHRELHVERDVCKHRTYHHDVER